MAVDYGRLAREAELALRIDAVALDIIEHARLIAEHTAERFDPVGSTYYLDQFLTVACLDFRDRAPAGTMAALAVPAWAGRVSVLTRTKLPILEYPEAEPRWCGTFIAVGVANFGQMPSLLNPRFDFAAVYPCRAPSSDEWLS